MPRNNPSDAQQTTKDLIKCTFLSQYKQKPLSRIFVNDLTQTCNISRGTFYFYYENVEQLYHECELDLIKFMEYDLDKVILCTVGGSRENIPQYIRAYAEHLSRYPERLEEFHCLLCGSERTSFRILWISSIRCHFEKTLPFSRTISKTQQEYLLEFFSGGTMQMLSNWILDDCKTPAEIIAGVHAQILFQGTFLSSNL